jgi:hypothetical protein
MRLGLLTMVMIARAAQLSAPAYAQHGMEVSSVILVHPAVPTMLLFPEDIEAVWSIGRGEVMVKGVGRTLYLRPRPATPAGVEVFIEVKTATLHRLFQLRVVERAEDAARELTVPPATATQGEASASAIPRGGLPALPEPAPGTPPPRSRDTGQTSEPEPGAPAHAHTAPEPPGQHLVLSLHALVALAGATAVEVAGYEPDDARQSHRAAGVRLAAAPRDARWSLEASIVGEWPTAPTTHDKLNLARHEILTLHGPWLRAEVGMRARLGTTVMPTAYAGIGLQARFLEIEVINETPMQPDEDEAPADRRQDMPFGGVLSLGLGLEYRAGDVLLGFEFQMRQGVPADYRSVEALLSVGFYLDHGE